MKKILITYGIMSIIFLQTSGAQDNSRSIRNDHNAVWGDQGARSGLFMNGMNDMQTNDDGPGDPSVSDPAAEVPVDGGLSILLVAGAAYGVQKIRRRQNSI